MTSALQEPEVRHRTQTGWGNPLNSGGNTRPPPLSQALRERGKGSRPSPDKHRGWDRTWAEEEVFWKGSEQASHSMKYPPYKINTLPLMSFGYNVVL